THVRHIRIKGEADANFVEQCGARILFFFSSRRRHTRFDCDWSSDVCSSDLDTLYLRGLVERAQVERVRVLVADHEPEHLRVELRSEERRVGKEWRCRRSSAYLKEKIEGIIRLLNLRRSDMIRRTTLLLLS